MLRNNNIIISKKGKYIIQKFEKCILFFFKHTTNGELCVKNKRNILTSYIFQELTPELKLELLQRNFFTLFD